VTPGPFPNPISSKVEFSFFPEVKLKCIPDSVMCYVMSQRRLGM
jgi:hypothetical protein